MKFDDVAKKIEKYFSKRNISVRENHWYKDEEHEFIDTTMSCDAGEVVMYAKRFLSGIISEGTKDWDREMVYSRWLAVYDIYKSVMNQYFVG